MKYIKKPENPIFVNAVQWTGDNVGEILELAGESLIIENSNPPKVTLCTFTLNREFREEMELTKGDYIVERTDGQFYPMGPEIFNNMFEKAS